MAGSPVATSGSAALNQDAFSLGGLFFLDDAQWEAIQIHLPIRQRGPKRLDDRTVISGILQVLQSGCAWRDCPREYGPYMTVFNRHLRWTKRGIWQAIFDELLHNQQLRKLSFRTRPMQASGATLNDDLSRSTSGGPVVRNGFAIREHHRVQARVRLGEGFELPERMLAEMELKAIFRSHEDKSREKWIEPIVQWHLRRAALIQPNARDADVTDMRELAAKDDPGKDTDSRLKLIIALFNSDYLDAKTRLISALECINFYAAGGADGGTAARKILDILLLSSNKT